MASRSTAEGKPVLLQCEEYILLDESSEEDKFHSICDLGKGTRIRIGLCSIGG